MNYYSFYLAEARTPIDDWIFEDVKLPAMDAKAAIILHYFNSELIKRYKSPWMSNKHLFTEPTQWMVKQIYRRVIEYERKERPEYGTTLVQFKKIKTYSQHLIVTLFKEDHYKK